MTTDTDLIARLRGITLNGCNPYSACHDAADLIETRDRQLAEARAEIEQLTDELSDAKRNRDEWRSDFRALEKAIVGETGLSAMTVAAQARLYRPRAEKAEADLTRERAAHDATRKALADHNDLLRSTFAIAEREGVKGMVASTNWDAFYNRVAVVLKRHHQISNHARAKLREGK